MKTTFLALGFLILSVPAFAQSTLPSFIILPGAPVTGSAEDISDYQTVLAYQNSRTANDCTRANSEVKISLDHFFGAPYGTLTPAEVTRWSDFVNNFSNSASGAIGLAKKNWNRPRPSMSHSDIQPCVPRETSASYPSGHATIAEMFARVLEVAYPNRAADFKNRALEIAQDRMIGGVHYPSDIRDGIVLGDEIFDNQNQNGAFVDQILANP